MDVQIEDMIAAGSGAWKSLSFTSLGEAQVQRWLEMVWRGLPIPRLYDPSAAKKTALKLAVATAMAGCGVNSNGPFFAQGDSALKFEVIFFFARRRNETYPSKKDIDNIAKFLFDALQGPVYWNDKAIVDVVAKKRFTATANDAGFVEVKITTITI